jgi:hypothetical protein
MGESRRGTRHAPCCGVPYCTMDPHPHPNPNQEVTLTLALTLALTPTLTLTLTLTYHVCGHPSEPSEGGGPAWLGLGLGWY